MAQIFWKTSGKKSISCPIANYKIKLVLTENRYRQNCTGQNDQDLAIATSDGWKNPIRPNIK